MGNKIINIYNEFVLEEEKKSFLLFGKRAINQSRIKDNDKIPNPSDIRLPDMTKAVDYKE